MSYRPKDHFGRYVIGSYAEMGCGCGELHYYIADSFHCLERWDIPYSVRSLLTPSRQLSRVNRRGATCCGRERAVKVVTALVVFEA